MIKLYSQLNELLLKKDVTKEPAKQRPKNLKKNKSVNLNNTVSQD